MTILAWSEDGTEELVVNVDLPKSVIESATPTTFQLGADSPASVWINLYSSDEHLPYCSDKFSDAPPKPAVWRAESGLVKLSFVPPPAAHTIYRYRVDVVLEALTFRGPDGQIIIAPPIPRFGGFGGWAPG